MVAVMTPESQAVRPGIVYCQQFETVATAIVATSLELTLLRLA